MGLHWDGVVVNFMVVLGKSEFCTVGIQLRMYVIVIMYCSFNKTSLMNTSYVMLFFWSVYVTTHCHRFFVMLSLVITLCSCFL